MNIGPVVTVVWRFEDGASQHRIDGQALATGSLGRAASQINLNPVEQFRLLIQPVRHAPKFMPDLVFCVVFEYTTLDGAFFSH
jgi:hypothetical protein